MEVTKAFEAAIDEFAEAMKARMLEMSADGWTGWEHVTTHHHNGGMRLLRNAAQGVVKEDRISLVDTANLAMMIWRNLPSEERG